MSTTEETTWLDLPTVAGRWLAKSDDGTLYEAEVREACGGVLMEAIVHGYNYDWHPCVSTGFSHLKWTPDLSHT